jgi:tight adherence protein B
MELTQTSLLIGLLAFFAVAAAGFALSADGKLELAAEKTRKRVKTVGANQRNRASGASEDSGTIKRRAQATQSLKALNDKQQDTKKRHASLKHQIMQAGLELKEETFWFISLGVAVLFAGIAFMLQAPLPAIVAAAGIGLFGLPRWILGFMIGGRQKKFSSQLADGIDMIVRGVKSGLPLNQCLQIIAKESPEPLRSEFQRLVDGQAMGVPLDQNMNRMFERVPLPEVNFFSIVLIIQAKAGGNLSEALNNLSTVLRARKMLREKIKALSAEAKMSALIIGAMPFVVAGMLAAIRPQYVSLLITTDSGRVVLLVCAVSMILGILVMRKMINFKF